MKRLAVAVLILLLFAVPSGVALAAPPYDTVVETGETVNNDVIVLQGDVEVQPGATVNGNVTVVNGNVYIAGSVNGDLVLWNGNLEVADTADIVGDCVLLNGTFSNASSTDLRCTQVTMPQFLSNLSAFGFSNVVAERMTVREDRPFFFGRFLGGILQGVFSSLVLGFLAFVIASLVPGHLSQVEATVKRKPVASGAVGLLTAVAIPSLVLLLLPVSILLSFVCIGLLGFPIMFALLAALGAGALLGWVVVGNLVGERLAEPLALKKRSLPVTAALGTMVLTFLINLVGAFGFFPFTFAEGITTMLLLCVGLGAVTLTQFGSKPYPPALRAGDDQEAKVTAVLDTLPAE